MEDKPQDVDLSQVKPFDLTGVPSRANLYLGQFVVLLIALSPLSIYLFLHSGLSLGGVLWLYFGTIFWTLGCCVIMNNITNKQERLYKYVQRGVVADIHPSKTQVQLCGYTGANVYVRQWCTVPADTWRDAQIGQVIDLATVYKR